MAKNQEYCIERRMYWFQQHGAAVHITNDVRELLNKTFHGRVISRIMEHPWPDKSPDLSPLDYMVLECGNG